MDSWQASNLPKTTEGPELPACSVSGARWTNKLLVTRLGLLGPNACGKPGHKRYAQNRRLGGMGCVMRDSECGTTRRKRRNGWTWRQQRRQWPRRQDDGRCRHPMRQSRFGELPTLGSKRLCRLGPLPRLVLAEPTPSWHRQPAERGEGKSRPTIPYAREPRISMSRTIPLPAENERRPIAPP